MDDDSQSIPEVSGATESGQELQPLDYRVLNVMEERCGECLFSPTALVDPEWRREIIETCQDSGSFFVCHRASIEGGLIVCCRAFYDSQETQPVQLAKRMNRVRFVKADDLPKLNPVGRRTVSPDIAFLLALSGKKIEEE